jgi:hypothetical protein
MATAEAKLHVNPAGRDVKVPAGGRCDSVLGDDKCAVELGQRLDGPTEIWIRDTPGLRIVAV